MLNGICLAASGCTFFDSGFSMEPIYIHGFYLVVQTLACLTSYRCVHWPYVQGFATSLCPYSGRWIYCTDLLSLVHGFLFNLIPCISYPLLSLLSFYSKHILVTLYCLSVSIAMQWASALRENGTFLFKSFDLFFFVQEARLSYLNFIELKWISLLFYFV